MIDPGSFFWSAGFGRSSSAGRSRGPAPARGRFCLKPHLTRALRRQGEEKSSSQMLQDLSHFEGMLGCSPSPRGAGPEAAGHATPERETPIAWLDQVVTVSNFPAERAASR